MGNLIVESGFDVFFNSVEFCFARFLSFFNKKSRCDHDFFSWSCRFQFPEHLRQVLSDCFFGFHRLPFRGLFVLMGVYYQSDNL